MNNKNLKNKQGGFLQIVLAIVILLVIMKMSGLTFTSLIAWFKALLQSTI
jgi:hypothetical protein